MVLEEVVLAVVAGPVAVSSAAPEVVPGRRKGTELPVVDLGWRRLDYQPGVVLEVSETLAVAVDPGVVAVLEVGLVWVLEAVPMLMVLGVALEVDPVVVSGGLGSDCSMVEVVESRIVRRRFPQVRGLELGLASFLGLHCHCRSRHGLLSGGSVCC